MRHKHRDYEVMQYNFRAATASGIAPLPRFVDESLAITAFQINATGNAATAVPTMTEWGMIIFMGLAGLGSVYYVRRQRRTER